MRSVAVAVWALLGGLTFVVSLLAGTTSVAHAANSLQESTPAADSTINQSPTQIVLTFENPTGTGTIIQLVCEGDPITVGTVQVAGNVATLPVLATVPAGDCEVTYTTTDSEGAEDERGSFGFTVDPNATATDGSSPAATTTTAQSTTPSSSDDAEGVSSGSIWFGRVLSILGISVLFGSLVLIVAAWPEGPEYVLALRFLRAAWAVGLVGTIIYLVGLSAGVQGKSFGSGFNPSGWFDLFDGDWTGRAAIMRLVFVVASGWVVLKPERVIDPTTNMLALGIPALAVVTLGLSRTGGSWPFIGVIASIVHVLAMSVWVGGVVLLARVVLAGPGEEDLVHAVRGFGRISNPAIILTIASGLVQLYREVGGELFTSKHGLVLLLKTVVVAAMLFVGMTARQIARAKLARASDLTAGTADRLRRAFGTEAVIGVIVIAISGWLLTMPTGKDSGDDNEGYHVHETYVDAATGLDLELFLDPARAGLDNAIRVEVNAPDTGISGLQIVFHPPAATQGNTITQPIPLTGRGAAESPDGGGVPFDVAGNWTFEVQATLTNGTVGGVRNPFQVLNNDGSAADPSDVSVPPLSPTTTTLPPTTTSTTVPTTEAA